MPSSGPQTDHAVRGILVANAVTLAFAVWQDWSVLQLMWPFWAQSVIIGWYARQRILKLGSFCTEGMRINDRPVEPTRATQISTANFFAVHYGLFHLFFGFFLLTMTRTGDDAGNITINGHSGAERFLLYLGQTHVTDFLIFVALALGYVQAHRASHFEHLESDLAHTRNLGHLMMMPYLRILPMHFTIIFAFILGSGALWLFMLLKVVTDVMMHKIEHRMLQGPVPSSRSPADTRAV